MLKNVIVGQSGGPSAAINATLYGVIKECYANEGIDKIFGSVHGIEGIFNDNLVELNPLAASKKFDLLKVTPAAYLGSCRFKMPDDNEEVYEKIFDTFRAHNIGYFFYIGGNDSMDTVNKLTRYAEKIDSDIKILGLPKTVDNDLVVTDHTPGFGSAAKYIATTLKETLLDCNVYNKPSVTFIEIMGRHAGWLTASSSLFLEPASHEQLMIYLPEVKINLEKFLNDVSERVKQSKVIMIAVSEGVQFEDGRFVCEGNGKFVRDAFGHAALSGAGKVLESEVIDKLKLKTRSAELSVLQRCAGHCTSLTDLTESELVGISAVKYALNGETGKMVCIKREKGQYKSYIDIVDVNEVCNKEKFVPLEWITNDHFVTKDFFDYALPLIEGETKLTYKNGLPEYLTER